MDVSLVVLGVALLAVVFANVVMVFATLGALRDMSMKVVAACKPEAVEVLSEASAAQRRPARRRQPPVQVPMFDNHQPGWSADFARDLDAATDHSGNGVRG